MATPRHTIESVDMNGIWTIDIHIMHIMVIIICYVGYGDTQTYDRSNHGLTTASMVSNHGAANTATIVT